MPGLGSSHGAIISNTRFTIHRVLGIASTGDALYYFAVRDNWFLVRLAE
jgi:hypothetical protein